MRACPWPAFRDLQNMEVASPLSAAADFLATTNACGAVAALSDGDYPEDVVTLVINVYINNAITCSAPPPPYDCAGPILPLCKPRALTRFSPVAPRGISYEPVAYALAQQKLPSQASFQSHVY